MSDQKFYVHDRTRGYVGNSMVWWRKGHHGYTCNIDEAHEFSRDELKGMADDLVAYPVELVRKASEPHVTAQHEIRESGIPLGEKFGGEL